MAILRLFSRRSHPTIQTTALLSTIRDICSCGFTYSLPGPLCTISSNQVSFALRIASSQSAFSSPFCKWMDASCPLFLASPPWKLLQSATPLHLTSEYLLRSSSPLRLLSKDNQTIAVRYEENVQRTVKNERENVRESGINWTEGFFNFPNIISMSRLVSGPMLGWLIIEEYYVPAFIGLGISGATDWLDGYVARKMQVNSVVGSYLDPLADKVLIGCVVLAMLKNGLLHPGLVGLVIFRDLALIGGAFYKRAHDLGSAWKNWSDFINIDATHPKKVEPLFLSKVNTVFQLLLVAAALLQPELGIQETQTYITYLSWLVASTTIASSVAYGAQYLNLLGPANNFR